MADNLPHQSCPDTAIRFSFHAYTLSSAQARHLKPFVGGSAWHDQCTVLTSSIRRPRRESHSSADRLARSSHSFTITKAQDGLSSFILECQSGRRTKAVVSIARLLGSAKARSLLVLPICRHLPTMKQETDYVKQEPASSPAAMNKAETGQTRHDLGPDDKRGILGDGASAPSPVVSQHDIYDDYEVEDDGFEEVVAAYINAGHDSEMGNGPPAVVVAGLADQERLEMRGGGPEPPALGIHQPFAAREQDVARVAPVPEQPVEPVPVWIDLGGKIKIWDLEITNKDRITLARPVAFVQFGTVPAPKYGRLTTLRIFDYDGSTFLHEPFYPLSIVGIGLCPGQITFKAPIQPRGIVSFRAHSTPETDLLFRWLPRVTMAFPELAHIASGLRPRDESV